MEYIEIVNLSYLKRPVFKWTIKNSVGGSFSNSGEYRSLKALGKAFRSQYPDNKWIDCKVRLVNVLGFDINDKPVELTQVSYFAKVFGFN